MVSLSVCHMARSCELVCVCVPRPLLLARIGTSTIERVASGLIDTVTVPRIGHGCML
eukprot:m.208053 g.208053  ORF g.208053 m.208053 type:complete len:57 (-) comp24010_c0_seq1:145-315(-)